MATLTYLGAGGENKCEPTITQAANPNFGQFDLMRNDADASPQALQAQFRHRMAYGIQIPLSYTWHPRSTTRR